MYKDLYELFKSHFSSIILGSSLVLLSACGGDSSFNSENTTHQSLRWSVQRESCRYLIDSPVWQGLNIPVGLGKLGNFPQKGVLGEEVSSCKFPFFWPYFFIGLGTRSILGTKLSLIFTFLGLTHRVFHFQGTLFKCFPGKGIFGESPGGF